MVKAAEIAAQILLGNELKDKLLPLSYHSELFISRDRPKAPGRSLRLSFSTKQDKFPKLSQFHRPEIRGKALHFFANHELLAIECMAYMLLYFPNGEWKRSVCSTLKDEQRHLALYLSRMEELGVELGDYSLNDFFWAPMKCVQGPAEYFSLMGLTFEAANLDFCQTYANVFKETEDLKSRKVVEIVYRDELSHVAHALKWLNSWKSEKKLWDYYINSLPKNFTPMRSKGTYFHEESRVKCGMDLEFINSLKNYQDDFPITSRRLWKKAII